MINKLTLLLCNFLMKGIDIMRNLWTEDEIEILKQYYPIMNHKEIHEKYLNSRSAKAIKGMAIRLGIKKLEEYKSNGKPFSQQEIEIIKTSYLTMDNSELLLLLPGRSIESIWAKASKLGLHRTNSRYMWTKEEENFIRNNWETMSDYEIAKSLNVEHKKVWGKRLYMGFQRDFKERNYEELSKFLRSNINAWKLKSAELCDYKCLITGSKDFQIHHLYGLSFILADCIKNNNLNIKDTFSDYTDEELDYIKECFLREHEKHPYGVCLHPEVHKLFHSMYGKKTTEGQWEDFYNKCKNNEIDLSFVNETN